MKVIPVERFQKITAEFSRAKTIMVAGDVGIDKYTMGEVRRISPEAPVPVLEVTGEKYKLGLAANVSHNLVALGVKTELYGAVGDDRNANLFDELLREEKLSGKGIVRNPGRPTTFKERVATDVQQICRIDYERQIEINAETEKQLIKKITDDLGSAGALIIEDYSKGALTPGVLTSVIKECHARKVLVTLDPGRNTDPRLYKGVDLLKPNLKEARLMSQGFGYRETDPKKIAQALMEKLELGMIAITLGAEGMLIIDQKNGGEVVTIPTIKTEVYDVSGAGDTAISVLTAALISGANLEEASWIANCASGVVVGKKGTATVNLHELSAYYNRLRSELSAS